MHYEAAYDTLNYMDNSSWQEELRESSRDPAVLAEFPGVQPQTLELASSVRTIFPFKATRSFLQRIEKNNPNDPLLLQILPVPEEATQHEGFSKDPLGEEDAQKVPGLLHKYYGRVLLVSTGACAIHCRYCFRQHFPYTNASSSQQNWQTALSYIRADHSIKEVILSGGDPLILTDNKLAFLIEALSSIDHVTRLRIHSRIPVVLPSRINESFMALFHDIRLKVIMVLHTNHANEIDDKVEQVLTALVSTGMPILNQSVLLRGVNDSSQALVDLSERLFDCGVLPYYLHMLDEVEGATHFVVEESKAREIMHELRLVLPGYLVPRLVREQAGAPYKLPLL